MKKETLKETGVILAGVPRLIISDRLTSYDSFFKRFLFAFGSFSLLLSVGLVGASTVIAGSSLGTLDEYFFNSLFTAGSSETPVGCSQNSALELFYVYENELPVSSASDVMTIQLGLASYNVESFEQSSLILDFSSSSDCSPFIRVLELGKLDSVSPSNKLVFNASGSSAEPYVSEQDGFVTIALDRPAWPIVTYQQDFLYDWLLSTYTPPKVFLDFNSLVVSLSSVPVVSTLTPTSSLFPAEWETERSSVVPHPSADIFVDSFSSSVPTVSFTTTTLQPVTNSLPNAPSSSVSASSSLTTTPPALYASNPVDTVPAAAASVTTSTAFNVTTSTAASVTTSTPASINPTTTLSSSTSAVTTSKTSLAQSTTTNSPSSSEVPVSDIGKMKREIIAQHNNERTARGFPVLSYSSITESYAQITADRLAGSGHLSHTASSQLLSWYAAAGFTAVGENIGQLHYTTGGTTVAFMASDDHRGALLNEGYDGIGVGIVCSQGTLWIAVHFSSSSFDVSDRLSYTTPSASPIVTPSGSGSTC